ncbi:MAG TPA: AraC family transcriptional regulator [Candidatus Limnocylindrales bacterium]
MRASYEHIEMPSQQSWKCWTRNESQFSFMWHYHHEYELTLITKGQGTRFVGDNLSVYEPGDLVLVGPDLPHTFASADGHTEHEAVVAQFLPSIAAGLPEFAPIASLLARARRGLRFPRDSQLAQLRRLPRLPPAERTVELLAILLRLARVRDATPLAGTQDLPVLDRSASTRMDAICRLLHAEHTRPLRLAEIAAEAHLSPSATSRFFRRTSGITLSTYLTTLRVQTACSLLLETDRHIAQIATDCGLANLAHFNRTFLRLKGITPRQYRAARGPGPR